MKLVLVGLSHRTAPVEVRERFASSEVPHDPGFAEAAVVSTCNRIEHLVVSHEPERASVRLCEEFGAENLEEISTERALSFLNRITEG